MLEELKRPEAEQRQIEGRRLGGEIRQGSASRPIGREAEKNVTRSEIAEALGMSPTQYQRAKTVVTTAEDESMPAPVREAAQAAVAAMDTGTLTISAAERKAHEAR